MNFVLTIFSILFNIYVDSNCKMVMLSSKEGILRPLAYTKADFWQQDSNEIDTLHINDLEKLSRIDNRLMKMIPINNEIDYKRALIRYKNGVCLDTIYTDSFFHDWEINNRFFEDKSEELKVLFYSLLSKKN